MRHLLANIAIYTISAILVLGAVAFAWLRSAQITLSNESTVLARFDAAEIADFSWADLGEDSYRRNCAACHGPGGGGWDQYPGLGHAAGLLRAQGGRDYLIDLHLYGLASDRWRVPMPPMGHMQDAELAAVINHVLTRLDDSGAGIQPSELYLPADIAARRGVGLQPREVERGRPAGR